MTVHFNAEYFFKKAELLIWICLKKATLVTILGKQLGQPVRHRRVEKENKRSKRSNFQKILKKVDKKRIWLNQFKKKKTLAWRIIKTLRFAENWVKESTDRFLYPKKFANWNLNWLNLPLSNSQMLMWCKSQIVKKEERYSGVVSPSWIGRLLLVVRRRSPRLG